MISDVHHVKNLACLTVLVHHRWALPVLGELYREDGAKFVTLVYRLNISKDSLVRTLDRLKTLDLAVKNPGYGHPLRPEYVLTPQGQVLGSSILPLLKHAQRFGFLELLLKKWSLPVLWAVHQGFGRFTDLLGALPNITSRALSLAVQDLEGIELLQREGSSYRLTNHGLEIVALLETLTESLPESLVEAQ
jgi:DNA-binding HxlR family transcriptional regulator